MRPPYRMRCLVTILVAVVLSSKSTYGEEATETGDLVDFLTYNEQDFIRPLTYGENLRLVSGAKHAHIFSGRHGSSEYSQQFPNIWGTAYSSNYSLEEKMKIHTSLSSIQSLLASLPTSDTDLVSLVRETKLGDQNPEQVTDFETCSADMLTMMNAAKDQKKWAIKMLDAWGKPGPGLTQKLQSPVFLGQFDECLETQVTGERFSSQHCIQYMGFTKIGPISFPQPLPMVVGTCVPSTCSAQNLSSVINLYLLTQQLFNVTGGASPKGYCYNPDLPLSNKAIAVVVICSIFAALMVTASLYDILVVHGAWQSMVSTKDVKGSFQLPVDSVPDGGLGETEPLLSAQVNTKTFEPNTAERALLCFSVYTNGAKLLATKTAPGSIDCIHGIRFLSMSWVILGHCFVMGLQVTDNVENYLVAAYKRWTFQAIMNATVSVDSFFTISGLLMVYLVMKELRKKPPTGTFFLNFYFHRFWRLTPPYILVLMVYVTLFHYTGDGPFWPQTGIEPGECESNWWSNLLYINNLHNFGGKPMCMAWSWYLANDMQFYVISPAIFLIMYYWGWWGLVLPSVLILASAITAGTLSAHYDLFANFDMLKPPTTSGDDYDSVYYMKPYCRIGPYLVGMIAGFILYRTDCKVRMSRLANCLGWALASAVALSVVYGLFESTNGHPISTGVAALYNALARTAWGAAVCWVIFACATGYGGPVNTLLSWKALVPLSRLTYCAYLIHILILYYFFFSQRSFFYLDNTNIVFLFISTLGLAMMVAFVTSMAFEAPFMGLEKILLGSLKSRVKRAKEKPYKSGRTM